MSSVLDIEQTGLDKVAMSDKNKSRLKTTAKVVAGVGTVAGLGALARKAQTGGAVKAIKDTYKANTGAGAFSNLDKGKIEAGKESIKAGLQAIGKGHVLNPAAA